MMTRTAGSHTLTRALAILAGLALLAGFSLSAHPAYATLQPVGNQINYYVNSSADTHDANPGNGTCADASGHCTLRAAIEEANFDSGPTIVNIFVPAYIIALTLHSPLEPGNGPYKNITHIYGTGYGRLAPTTVIDGLWRSGNPSSCYTPDVYNPGSTTIAGVRLTGGCAADGGDFDDEGGAVQNLGTLSISSSVITGNFAENGGGGIFNGVLVFFAADAGIKVDQNELPPNSVGMLNVTGTEISHNSTLGWGGGILSQTICEEVCLNLVCIVEPDLCVYNVPSTSMTLSNDPIHDNTAGFDGGGVYNAGGAQINDSSLYRNVANGGAAVNSGGGVFNAAGSTLEISGTKLLNNTSLSDGGGLTNAAAGTYIGINPILPGEPLNITVPGAQASLTRALVQGNTARTNGGGIENNGRLWLYDSRILSNTAGSAGIDGNGGGIFSSDHLMIMGSRPADSVIAGNKALGPVGVLTPDGGGIMAIDQTWITNTSITQNSAAFGGGIGYDTTEDFRLSPAQENLQLQTVTLRSNTASMEGGGLYFVHPVTTSASGQDVPAQGRLNNTLVTANSAGETAGGIYNENPCDPVLSGTSQVTGNTAPSHPNLQVSCP
jgi:CSLREA domain-containing protein